MHRPSTLKLRSANLIHAVKGDCSNTEAYCRALKPRPPCGKAQLNEPIILKLQETCRGISVHDVYQECLSVFAKNPHIYGSLGTAISREYDEFIKTSLKEKERSDFWLFAEREVEGVATECAQAGAPAYSEVIEGLKTEVRDLQNDLYCKCKRAEDLEERVEQLRGWLALKTEKLSEAQLSLDVAREYIDAQIVDKQTPKVLEPDEQQQQQQRSEVSMHQAKELQALQESASQYQQTISEQLDQKNVLEDRLEFIQDLLRAKITHISALEEENKALKEINQKLVNSPATPASCDAPLPLAVQQEAPQRRPGSGRSSSASTLPKEQKTKSSKSKRKKKQKKSI
eukprot:TRINITY_DN27698_c0_g1_i1.p1 TRINITY_DN27698_c0_g1~~TRINITY_DN27698_c0_g1_i1.p1  ORF type:complete len:342 (+),score=52.06 TRINITY_DN27698_c0_g1_i1:35-1060(+)